MHGLRKYFRNNMKADPSYREFWMGHSLGVDEHYVTRDPEAHRAEYRKGYESLRILEPATPAQLTEIVEQLKKKDLEIQELRKEIKEMGEYIDLLLLQAPIKDPKQQARIILKVLEILKRKEPRKEKESA
jgi:hypothetical protein